MDGKEEFKGVEEMERRIGCEGLGTGGSGGY